MNQTLEARLGAIEISVPSGLTERAMAQAGRRAPRSQVARKFRTRLVVSLALFTVLFGGNMTAAYFLPRYGEALAGTYLVGAISGPVLRAAGLANAQLTSANETAVFAGHSLRLVAAYADTDRTILFVEIDGQPLQVVSEAQPATGAMAIGDVRVSDQFGHHYQPISGPHSVFDPIEVEPLVWPASVEGARLTIEVANIAPVGGPHQLIPGSWTLHVTLFQKAAKRLPLPLSGSIGGTHYSFTAVHLSSALLQIHIRVTGDAVKMLDQVNASRPADAAGQRARGEEIGRIMSGYFKPTLIAPDGSVVSLRSWDAGDGLINATYPGVGPGTYHVVIGDPGIGLYDSTIVVPAS
jgi:hypothetical protein